MARKEVQPITDNALSGDVVWSAYISNSGKEVKPIFKEFISHLPILLHDLLDHEFSWETIVKCHNLVLKHLCSNGVIDTLIARGLDVELSDVLSWANSYSQLAQKNPDQSWKLYASAGNFTCQMEYFGFFGFGLSKDLLRSLELRLNGDENVSLPTVRKVISTTPKIFIPFELRLKK